MERWIILGVLLTALLLAALWVAARPRLLTARLRRRPVPEVVRNGRPAVLAFTSPDCAACRTTQRPALEDLAARLGGRVRIQEVDVLAQPQLARTFGIFSVPSTVVVDRRGRVLAFNIGFASADRLHRQVLLATRNGNL